MAHLHGTRTCVRALHPAPKGLTHMAGPRLAPEAPQQAPPRQGCHQGHSEETQWWRTERGSKGCWAVALAWGWDARTEGSSVGRHPVSLAFTCKTLVITRCAANT